MKFKGMLYGMFPRALQLTTPIYMFPIQSFIRLFASKCLTQTSGLPFKREFLVGPESGLLKIGPS